MFNKHWMILLAFEALFVLSINADVIPGFNDIGISNSNVNPVIVSNSGSGDGDIIIDMSADQDLYQSSDFSSSYYDNGGYYNGGCPYGCGCYYE